MPYLKPDDREKFVGIVSSMRKHPIASPGELNYLCTELVKHYLKNKKFNYELLNSAVGALESCKLEFYRRTVSEYEDYKAAKNGDVYADSSDIR